MKRAIISSAIKTEIPESPLFWIDSSCQTDGENFKDRVGKSFTCTEELAFWTDGVSNGVITGDSSPINEESCSVSLCFSGKAKTPLLFGNGNADGVWLEISNSAYDFRTNAGSFFHQAFDGKFTFAFVKSKNKYRFFHDGAFVSETTLNQTTAEKTAISIGESDKLVNLFVYDKALSDAEIKSLYLSDFQSSTGFDHLGYRTSSQEFSLIP